MTLKVVSSSPGPEGGGGGPRILAPGAPPSSGPLPNELAQHLVRGEALVWWGDKNSIRFGPVLMILGVALAVLALVTLLAPEFWAQPPRELAKPIGVLLSPAAFVLVRERINRRAVLVTDASITSIDMRGRAQRLPLGGIAKVRRDPLRGGMVLEGRQGQVRLPPVLLDDTRQAIASQRRHSVRGSASVDDPQGWLP